MKRQQTPILGVIAPRARQTLASATWLALVLSVPTFVLLTVGEALWRWWFGAG